MVLVCNPNTGGLRLEDYHEFEASLLVYCQIKVYLHETRSQNQKQRGKSRWNTVERKLPRQTLQETRLGTIIINTDVLVVRKAYAMRLCILKRHLHKWTVWQQYDWHALEHNIKSHFAVTSSWQRAFRDYTELWSQCWLTLVPMALSLSISSCISHISC